MARFPPPSAIVMKEKNAARPVSRLAIGPDPNSTEDIPTGANISWSHAMRFNAGTVAASLVMGNARDRAPYQWNWRGDQMKPHAMNRVRRSKSKGGAWRFELGSISLALVFESRSRSVIWMDRNSSFCTKPDLRDDRIFTAVRVWAKVSAIPPRTFSHQFAVCVF